MQLSGRRAFITGTSAGIGRTIAVRFAEEGAEIIAVDVEAGENEKTEALIHARGGRCTTITADVSVEDDVIAAFRRAGDVDLLVNNAASAAGDDRIPELSGDAWDKVLAVCLKSVFLCTREALISMRLKRRGVIINVSSVNALVGINLAAYTAAKGGILAFTRLTAAHHAAEGIRANAICPGTIISESSERYYREHRELEAELKALYPGGSFGKVEDIASCAVFLASDASSFINGAEIPVDGGLLATRPLKSLLPITK
jgi:3-oxoacyl-[acyl-carrier protein] reductase